MSPGTVFGREPALLLGAVSAIVTCAVAFGLNVTAEQVSVVNIAVAAIVAFAVRSQVAPTK